MCEKARKSGRNGPKNKEKQQNDMFKSTGLSNFSVQVSFGLLLEEIRFGMFRLSE